MKNFQASSPLVHVSHFHLNSHTSNMTVDSSLTQADTRTDPHLGAAVVLAG